MEQQAPDPRPTPREAPENGPRWSSHGPTHEPQPPPAGSGQGSPGSAGSPADAARLLEVLNRAPAAISVMEGPEHTVVVANPSFEELVCGRRLVGRPAREALPELEGHGIMELLDEVMETGHHFVGKELLLRLDRDADGLLEDGIFDLVLEPLRHEDGTVFGVMCHATEMTEQVQARRQLADARAEAERANRSKTDFLASMSHDLRTPLTAIAGYASLVVEGVYGPPTPGQKEAMARIARANDHLLALIDDVLRFAKIDGGTLALNLEPLPVGDVLAGIGMLVEPQIVAKGLSYDCAAVSEDVRVIADRERLTQILLNLLSNALKFTDTGTLRLECEPTDTQVRIRVADSGRGIPEEMISRIFDPFVQVSSGDAPNSGVGLGLATSLSLARAMNGELTVESEVGRGTVFTLVLPRP